MNLLRKLTIPFVAVLCMVTVSCGTFSTNFTPTQIGDGVTLAVSNGLYFIKDTSKRSVIAKYVDVYAHGLRTVTGAPTSDQLVVYLNSFIPASVAAQYPELGTLVTPLIVAEYFKIYKKYGNNAAKVYEYLNALAAGLERGVAPYLSTGTK